MKITKRWNILLICLLVFSKIVLAQAVDVQSILDKYPLEPFIYLNKTEKSVIKIIDNKLNVVCHTHEELLILKNNLSRTRSKKIRTSDLISIKNIKASLYVYNGKTHKKKKLNSIELKSENINDNSFYNDDKHYYVKFSEANEGDIVNIDYDVEYNEPVFFGNFYFSDYYHSLYTKVSVEFPIENFNLKIQEHDNQKLNLKAITDSTKKTKIISWTLDTVLALSEEDFDAGFKSKSTYVLMNIENYKTNESTVNVGGSLTNLYAWYMKLLKNVDLSEDPALIKLTDSLTQGKSSETEKMKAIYYWVQSKIAYIAYEDGLNGFVPREASVVCRQKYGDCKDMANLLVKMGSIAKLPTYRAWIGTRDIPYQFSEFPAPSCANHMISVFISANDTIFMDATGKNHPFSLPTTMIQGKEAFIGLNDSQYVISRVPNTNKEISSINDSISLIYTSSNTLKGNGYYSVTGYEKIKMLFNVANNPYNQQKEYLSSTLLKGNNKFRLDTFYTLPSQINKPFVIYYSFTLPDYVSTNGSNSYINLNLSKYIFDRLILDKRKYPIEISYKSIYQLSVTMNLSPNQEIEFVPTNSSKTNAPYSFDINYTHEAKTIRFKNVMSLNQLMIHENEFKSLENFINDYKKSKSHLVSIINKN